MRKTIEKPPGAKKNTFEVAIKNCISTNPDTFKSQFINARVMFTSDEEGEVLSIFDPSTKKQVIVPFDEVEQLIAYTRQQRKGVMMS